MKSNTINKLAKKLFAPKPESALESMFKKTIDAQANLINKQNQEIEQMAEAIRHLEEISSHHIETFALLRNEMQSQINNHRAGLATANRALQDAIDDGTVNTELLGKIIYSNANVVQITGKYFDILRTRSGDPFFASPLPFNYNEIHNSLIEAGRRFGLDDEPQVADSATSLKFARADIFEELLQESKRLEALWTSLENEKRNEVQTILELIKSKGIMQESEARQLIDRGVRIYDFLSVYTGIKRLDIVTMCKLDLIKSDDVVAVFKMSIF